VTQAFVSKRGSEEAADKNAIRRFTVTSGSVTHRIVARRVKATKQPEREWSRMHRKACS